MHVISVNITCDIDVYYLNAHILIFYIFTYLKLIAAFSFRMYRTLFLARVNAY